MKYISKICFTAGAVLLGLLPILVATESAGASGTATLSVSPSSTTLSSGASFNVDIHENSGSDQVNAVQANLSYSSNLTFVSIANSSAFTVDAQSSGGGGSVKIGRGTTSSVSGDQIVATVRFTVNGSGTATVSFGSGSAVVRSQDNGAEALSFVNGSYTISSNATMTLSPSTKTVTAGDGLDVLVYGDSGSDQVNAVQVNLSYQTNLLTFVSSTPNQSSWPITAQNTASGGVVKVGLGTTTPLTGSHLITTLHFTAAAAGNATLTFAGGSGMVRSSDNAPEPSRNTGGSYTILSAPTGGSSGGGTTTGSGGGTTISSSGGGTTTKSSGSTSKTGSTAKTVAKAPPTTYTTAPTSTSSPATAPVDSTGPEISDIKATNVTTKSATITWTTSEPATSEVDFGLDTQYILSASDSSLATSHSLSLDPKQLVPHKKYHFIVKSADAAGNQSVSDDMTFSTGGLQITTTEVAVGAGGAALLGVGAWLAAGGLKLGGGAAAAKASAAGFFAGPTIVAGGSPPPVPPETVIKPEQIYPNPKEPPHQ